VIVLPAITETVRFEVACAACLVAGIGLSGVQLLLQAMLADTLAVDAAESGQRRAGVLSGLWSAAETVSAAAGAGIYGLVLAASGFISSASGLHHGKRAFPVESADELVERHARGRLPLGEEFQGALRTLFVFLRRAAEPVRPT
jgi:Na+/melibiose symporter-like transporter